MENSNTGAGGHAASQDWHTAPDTNAPDKNGSIRLPTNYVGKLLDRGKASAAAIKLLAIKRYHGGPGFVVNQTWAARYGMGWRRYRKGVRLLQEMGIIVRWQDGRKTLAQERYVAAQSGNYVRVDPNLLNLPEVVLAFIIVTDLSPHPRRTCDVCGRIGITAEATIRKTWKAAAATGAISVREGPDGIFVGRAGIFEKNGGITNGATKCGPAKNGVTKGGAAKSGASLSIRKSSSPSERISPSERKSRRTEKSKFRNEGIEPSSGRSIGEIAREKDYLSEDHLRDVARLRQADGALLLAPALLSPDGMRGYYVLINRHGETALSTIFAKLTGAMIDGDPPGKVYSWEYFEGAIADEQKADWIVEHGLRPGDVLGVHGVASAPSTTPKIAEYLREALTAAGVAFDEELVSKAQLDDLFQLCGGDFDMAVDAAFKHGSRWPGSTLRQWRSVWNDILAGKTAARGRESDDAAD